jgi:hypothetical protein
VSNPFDEETDDNENLGPEGPADALKAAKSGGDVEFKRSGGDVESKSGGDVESSGGDVESSGGDVESEPSGDEV